MAAAVTPQAEALARLAVEETGFGVVADKVQKNLFASQRVLRVHQADEDRRRDQPHRRERKVIEIAEPFGVVAAVIPSTNPTSTAIYKILIAIKARCAVVMTPHPSAARCITCTADIMNEAGRRAGLPDGAIGWMKTVTLEGTQELMKAREVSVILATGGMGLVRAAYSAGKPAYGVGPGNAPCYIESSADVRKAANDILTGKSFDNGVLCSSPNSVVVDQAIDAEARRQFLDQGGYFLSPAEADALAQATGHAAAPAESRVCREVRDVHRADRSASRCPPNTRALIAELKGVGRDFPLSFEKLCPVLSYYVVKDWREGLRALQGDPPLRRHGPHHVDSLAERRGHSRVRPAQAGVSHLRQHADDARIDRLDDGAGSGDDARLRRLRRQYHLGQHHAEASHQYQAGRVRTETCDAGSRVPAVPEVPKAAFERRFRVLRRLPKAPAKPQPDSISADALTSRIDRFLASRGLAPGRTRGTCGTRRHPPGTQAPATAGAVRLRRRRPVGDPRRPKTADQRADDRYPVGARCRRGCEDLLTRGLALIVNS